MAARAAESARAAELAAEEAEKAAAADSEGELDSDDGPESTNDVSQSMSLSKKSSSSAATTTTLSSTRARPLSVKNTPFDPRDTGRWRAYVSRQASVGRKVSYLLATGNLVSSTGLDLMQISGYTVVADKINFIRFTTHFRSIHRGQFFTTMKTTTVRKLLPESWGFLCPVHTPDGGPCGLLNHFARPCSITSTPLDARSFGELCDSSSASKAQEEEGGSLSPSIKVSLTSLLVSMGMSPTTAAATISPATHLFILIDGCIVGSAPPHLCHRLSRALRTAKALAGGVSSGVENMPRDEEEERGVSGSSSSGSSELELATVVSNEKTAVAGLVRCVVRGGCCFNYRNTSAPRGLQSLGSIGHVPPSLEVAFIPPPWWDNSLDGSLDPDSPQACTRMLLCSFPDKALAGTPGASDISSSSSSSEGSKAQAPERLAGLFPGLYLHTSPARPIRPVLQLDTGLVELLSPLEQLSLDIAVTPEDAAAILGEEEEERGGDSKENTSLLYTHIELSPRAMLSEVAQLTPFSDMNQSPRNMYQCQMAKQTMGTPAHALGRRCDSKLHRLQNPQAPLVQNAAQSEFGFDEYPNGANACVAVLSYTGYDMEDACIINKASFERGWGWAAVYKCYSVDILDHKPVSDASRYTLHNTLLRNESRPIEKDYGMGGDKGKQIAQQPVNAGDLVYPSLDADGLPPPGAYISPGAPLYAYLDLTLGKHECVRHKEGEGAYVEEVRLFPSPANSKGIPGLHRASIKLRFDRRPVVGDKFSSRHGQKGVLSYLWPSENMPFTDRGQQPDVLINPHAFPSRMTVGMLVEMMAGKAGALEGSFQDSTPFRYNEKERAVDKFGEALAAAGYSYYGTESMTSGITGEPLGVDIFYGCVYYQRLRHMVKDKAQVRSTGASNALTGQPVKGRKKGGGVRFGEMERDALISHGAAFLLHDRLHLSSDKHNALVCKGCGSLLAPFTLPSNNDHSRNCAHGGGISYSNSIPTEDGGPLGRRGARRTPMCASCGTGKHCVPIQLPYVFRYLANELAAMGVKITMKVGEGR